MNETSSLINLDLLYRMCNGSEQMVQTVIGMFVSTTPDSMKELEEHFANRSSEDLKNIAHKVKSSFLTLGASEIAEKLQQIEASASKGELDYLESLVGEVLMEADAIIQELTNKNNAA